MITGSNNNICWKKTELCKNTWKPILERERCMSCMVDVCNYIIKFLYYFIEIFLILSSKNFQKLHGYGFISVNWIALVLIEMQCKAIIILYCIQENICPRLFLPLSPASELDEFFFLMFLYRNTSMLWQISDTSANLRQVKYFDGVKWWK